jgi:hypothetical protein
MGTGRTTWWKRPAFWAVVAAVAVIAAGLVIALNLRENQPVANPPVEPTSTPTQTVTETETPTPSESETTEELTAETPYCEAFRTIIAGGMESGSENEAENLKALSAKYAEYLEKYQTAAELAPESLQDEYDKVIAFLKDAIKAVDSGDFDRIKAVFKSLATLNDTMTAIDEESRRICA